MAEVPEISLQATLGLKGELPDGVSEVVCGYDFNKGIDYEAIFASYRTMGIQATNLSVVIDEINRMLDKKLEGLPEDGKSLADNPVNREPSNCTIFLSFTSNMISAGTRELIRYIVEHNMVDVLVTTCGGIEEDIMKCLAPTYIGDFHRWRGEFLRQRGVNRIGNMLVPNGNYCALEDWVTPILDEMKKEQDENGTNWTPSKFIAKMGEKINDPSSVLYWCWKNRIPVFCPGITDGALGDHLYFHSYKNPGLRMDIAEDVRRINLQAVYARHTGMIILGGGIIKHHTCNANLMRNGADFCVYINTAAEFDCSDAGAPPDEAVSWGKVRPNVRPVKLTSDASLVLPIIVAQTFAKAAPRFAEMFKKANCEKK